MKHIKQKPLTINQAWQGRRFKTEVYKNYETILFLLLPKELKIPKGKLTAKYLFGVSNVNCDYDNFIKAFQDILQKKYKFNDKKIYSAIIEKVDVPKGEEFIQFHIGKFRSILLTNYNL